jgi:arginine decarboxylase
VVRYGKLHKYGLEAGSKPELLIALATMTNEGALVTCNGYKDSDYGVEK